METIKCKTLPNTTNKTSKIAKKIQKVISLKKPSTATTNGIASGICMLQQHNQEFENDEYDEDDDKSSTISICMPQSSEKQKLKRNNKRKAALEALLAKLFAGVTTIKAAYAEMQMAQNPYNNDAIEVADQAIVVELKQLSELKRSFYRNNVDQISPQVTLLLAEIQEQQSMMKTYEITIKKLETEVRFKDKDVFSLKKRLNEIVEGNKVIEKKLNESGPLSVLDHVKFMGLNTGHFLQFLHHTLRSIKSFTRFMVKEMENAKWDLELAAKAIEREVTLVKTSHSCFVFEAFVCKTMFNDFFGCPCAKLQANSPYSESEQRFNQFKNMKSGNPKQFLVNDTIQHKSYSNDHAFARFVRAKYVQVVHAKMECSFFGNLNQRKLLTSGGIPDSGFFTAFVEMARRVWCLNLLAFSFGENVSIFQVKKNCRFSEVYMESVTEDMPLENPDNGRGRGGGDSVFRVGFTVVPGFRIGRTLIQLRVYVLPPVASCASS